MVAKTTLFGQERMLDDLELNEIFEKLGRETTETDLLNGSSDNLIAFYL
jgi:hypothetical protein